jgi:agmatine deiminase
MPQALGYRMPAEWEPHEATWLAWPHHRTDWPGKLAAIPWVFAEMARHLCQGERVRVLVESRDERQKAERTLARAHVDLEKVDFVLAATNRSWARDYLPLFVTKKNTAGKADVVAVKWRFNGWARYRDHELDNLAGVKVARRFSRRMVRPRDKTGYLVLEGGSVDVDGQGTLITTEECLLTGARARAKHLGREDMERVLGDYLGVERVIWLGSGIAGDDTSGHVDDFARFVAPGRVVISTETRRSDRNWGPLRAAQQALAAARDAKGRQLEVVPLPMPAPLVYDGQRLPASYANFYIANGRVLVPTFNDPNDRVALGLMEELFPQRQVIGIHAVDLVLGLGTMHCSTMQHPATH